jgi:polar amino acid transport system substrate-binding protein
MLLMGNTWASEPLCPPDPIRYAHYEFGLLYTPESGGIDEDIRRELERRSGCRFEVSLRLRARIWRDLETGHLDMAGSGVQTAARDAYVWFAHYVIERNVVALSDRVPAAVRDFDGFRRQTQFHLGSVRSFSFGPVLDTEVARLRALGRVYDVSDTRTLYRMFDFQRYDAFIGSQFLHLHYFKSLGLPVPKRLERWDTSDGTPSGLVLAKSTFSPAQAQAWQALVRDMLRDGTVRRIVASYLGKDADEAVFRPAVGKPQ